MNKRNIATSLRGQHRIYIFYIVTKVKKYAQIYVKINNWVYTDV